MIPFWLHTSTPKRLQNWPQERGADERREALRWRKRGIFNAPVALALLRSASSFAATPFRRLRRGPRRRRVCPDPLPRPPRSWRKSFNAAPAWTLELLPSAKLENLDIRFRASGAFGGEQHYSSFRGSAAVADTVAQSNARHQPSIRSTPWI